MTNRRQNIMDRAAQILCVGTFGFLACRAWVVPDSWHGFEYFKIPIYLFLGSFNVWKLEERLRTRHRQTAPLDE